MVHNMGDEISNTWTLEGHVKNIAAHKTGLRKRKIRQEKHKQVDFVWKWIEMMSGMFDWPCFVPMQLCTYVCFFTHDFNSDVWWDAFNLAPVHLLWVENIQGIQANIRLSKKLGKLKERPGAWWEFQARRVTECGLINSTWQVIITLDLIIWKCSLHSEGRKIAERALWWWAFIDTN